LVDQLYFLIIQRLLIDRFQITNQLPLPPTFFLAKATRTHRRLPHNFVYSGHIWQEEAFELELYITFGTVARTGMPAGMGMQELRPLRKQIFSPRLMASSPARLTPHTRLCFQIFAQAECLPDTSPLPARICPDPSALPARLFMLVNVDGCSLPSIVTHSPSSLEAITE
jgi:hypothetical protein